MIQGLFFHRVDTEAAGTTVRSQHNLVIFADADETQATLPLPELAVSRAQVALQTAAVKWVPVPSRDALGSEFSNSISRLSRHTKIIGANRHICNEDGIILLHMNGKPAEVTRR